MTPKLPLAALALAAALSSPLALAQDTAPAPDKVQADNPAPVQEPAAAAADAPDKQQDVRSDAGPAPFQASEAPAPGKFSDRVANAIGTPPEGKALVVFFRPSKFVGAAIGFKVRENEVELGKLRNGNYFVLAVDPGEHRYVVHSEAKDVTTIEAEAGEVYFLSGSISMGVMAGRPNLSPADAAAFEAVLPKLKPSKPLD